MSSAMEQAQAFKQAMHHVTDDLTNRANSLNMRLTRLREARQGLSDLYGLLWQLSIAEPGQRPQTLHRIETTMAHVRQTVTHPALAADDTQRIYEGLALAQAELDRLRHAPD